MLHRKQRTHKEAEKLKVVQNELASIETELNVDVRDYSQNSLKTHSKLFIKASLDEILKQLGNTANSAAQGVA